MNWTASGGWRWAAAVPLAVCIAAECQRDGGAPAESSEQPPAGECPSPSAVTSGEDAKAACEVRFHEIARLEGTDSITPYPVISVANGQYVTATYHEGTFALWSPGGELRHVRGEGPGEGPGEFRHPTGFAQYRESELLVLSGTNTLHRYSFAGRFLRSHRLAAAGGAGLAVTYGDMAVTSARTAAGEQAFALHGDSVRPFGVPAQRRSTLLLAAADQIGIWSVEHDRYVLRRHALPAGSIADSLVVARAWFPDPGGDNARIDWFHADGRGLLWVVARVSDPDAPGSCDDAGADHRPMNEIAGDMEAYRAMTIACDDAVVEALTSDGRLAASVRYDSVWDQPVPFHANLWFLPSDDLASIGILEARVTAR